MIGVELDAASVARIRFASSPVYESAAWLAWTAAKVRHPLWGDPGPAARFAMRDPTVARTASLLRGMVRSGYVPDFLTPKPEAGDLTADGLMMTQLERVRACPEAAIHDQLAQLTLPPAARREDPERLAAVAAAGLTCFWRTVMHEIWPRLAPLLRQDQHQRMATAWSAGMGSVLSCLHPLVRWTSGELLIDKPYDERVTYRDTELVLVPTLTGWPRLAVQVCNPMDATIAYPAVAATSTTRPGLEPLLGRGRTQVLQAVGAPSSTTQLSQQLGLAAATVSHHLHILYCGGLLTRTRQGHRVLYQRTLAAEHLLESVPR